MSQRKGSSPLIVHGPKRSRWRPACSIALTITLYTVLLVALAGNYLFWTRLVRQAEELHLAGDRVRFVPVHSHFEVKMNGRTAWMSKNFLGGQIYLAEELQGSGGPVARANHGTLLQRPHDVRRLCMYGERCSGTTWVNSLIARNFYIEIDEGLCPNKHDYENAVPNEFLFPSAETLVVTVLRNAFDWTASFYRVPWGAANHCNVTFETFLTREWSYGNLKGTHPFCPKYEGDEANYMHTKISMYYEATHGRHPADVMELRRWKLQRQVDLCAMRSQAVCVQYEGVLADWRGWLVYMRDRFSLKPKPGFPNQVDHYKGLSDHAIFKPHSEYDSLVAGQHTQLFNATTIALVQQRLDLRLEAALGYQYNDISTAVREPAARVAAQRKSRARMWS